MFRKRKRKQKANVERLGSTVKAREKKQKAETTETGEEGEEDKIQQEELFDEEVQNEGYEDLLLRIKRGKIERALKRSATTFGNKRKKRKIEKDDLIVTIDSDLSAARHDGDDQGATRKKIIIDRYKRNDGEVTFKDGKELYKGMGAYVHKAGHQDSEGVNKTSRIGPARAPAGHAPTCIYDYNPSICKDYKETGFCGYGDSCKFLHDRTDYKMGWQIEKDWEIAQKKRADRLSGKNVSDDESDYEIKSDEELPFACYLCRKPFVEPVKTYCNHYFCRECAIKSFRKTPGCRVCGANTEGVFMAATEIREKMRLSKRDAEKEAEAEAAEAEQAEN